MSTAWTSARDGNTPSEPEPDRFEAVAGFELAEAVKSHPLALVPLGSLEYHGPYNPLGTDSIIVSGIAERVAARAHLRSIRLPTFVP